MAGIHANIIELMGGTPLVELGNLSKDLPGTVAAKLEAFNPAGSVKDRIGVSMIDAAEKAGEIEPGKTTIVEATSGNTGIALAFVAAARGYEIILTLPEGMSRERQGLLKLYGAKVEIVESMGGMGEAVEAARKLGKGEGYFLPDQFSNPANPDIHRRTTAEEIWTDTGGKVDVFVAGVGTGGTITGVGERLKERKAGVKSLPSNLRLLRCSLAARSVFTEFRESAPGLSRRSSTVACSTRSWASKTTTRLTPHATSRVLKESPAGSPAVQRCARRSMSPLDPSRRAS